MNESDPFPSFTGDSNENLLANMTQGYVPVWTQVLYFTYVGIIFVSGIPGNLVIMIVYTRTKPKKSCDWFILFIGFTDFMVCLVSPILCVHMELGIEMPYINGLMCGFEHLWQLTAMSSSCFILTVMSMERYIRVCHPTRKSFTPDTSRNISILCIILAFLFSTYPSIGQFQKERCGHLDNVSGMPLIDVHIYFCIYLLCFITVAFAYGRVIATIEEKIKVRKRLINNSGLYDNHQNSKKEVKEENDVKVNDGKENASVCADGASDKNDSGFNQIEEAPFLPHNCDEAEEDKTRGETLAISPDKDIGDTPNGNKNLPVIYLTEDSGDHLPPKSISESQRLQEIADSENEAIIIDPKDEINITVNPFFSNSTEFDKNESDVDLIDDAVENAEHGSVNANGGSFVLTNEKVSATSTPTEKDKSGPNDELIPSPEKSEEAQWLSHQGSVTRRSGKERTHLAAAVDDDYLEEDLYSDIGQPVPFFQKAKQAVCEKIASSKKKRSENSRRKRWLRERQVTIMLVSITAVFLFSWIPPWLFYLVAAHGVRIFPPGVITRVMYRHFDKIFLLNYFCNFPIYYRFNTTFRIKAKAVLPKWMRKYCLCWCFHNLDGDNDSNNASGNEGGQA